MYLIYFQWIQVDWFVLHYPYFLLLLTVVLYLVERFFTLMNNGNVTQNKFYALLIDYNILDIGKDEVMAGDQKLVSGDEFESSIDLLNLRERLAGSSSYYYSYLSIQVGLEI